VLHYPYTAAAKETTLREVGEMLTHVAKHMVTKENLEAVRSELKGKGYSGLGQLGYRHQIVRSSAEVGENLLPLANRVASLLDELVTTR
jgi:hypothetical protein